MKNNIIFETERLQVTIPSTSDFENLVKLYTNEKIMVYFGGIRSKELIMQKMHEFLKYYKLDGFGYGLVYKKDSGELIGRAGLNRYEFKRDTDKIECGIILLPEYWNSGYATELLDCLIKYSFNSLKLPELYATIDENNAWSIKLATNLGFNLTKKVIHFDEPKHLYVKFKK